MDSHDTNQPLNPGELEEEKKTVEVSEKMCIRDSSNNKLYLLNRLLFTQKALSTKLSEQGLYTLNEFLYIYFTGVCSNVATRKS